MKRWTLAFACLCLAIISAAGARGAWIDLTATSPLANGFRVLAILLVAMGLLLAVNATPHE